MSDSRVTREVVEAACAERFGSDIWRDFGEAMKAAERRAMAKHLAEAERPRYVVDRDGDLWQSTGGASWACLTTASAQVGRRDLVSTCGPVIELGGDQRNVLRDAGEVGALWTGDMLDRAE